MSDSTEERIARLEVRMDAVEAAIGEQRPMLQGIMSSLDRIKGGSAVVYALMAASASIGGLIVALFPRLGS